MFAFSTTCRRVRQLWISNAPAIIRAQLPSMMIGYEQAEKLAEEQEKVSPWIEQYPGVEQASLFTFLRRIQRNAHEVEWVGQQFEDYYMPLKAACPKATCHDRSPTMTPREKARFTHGFYFVRRCVVSYLSSDLNLARASDIQKFTLENLLIACDIMDWLLGSLDMASQERLEIPDHDPPYYLIDIEDKIATPQWREAGEMLSDEFHARMTKIGWASVPSFFDRLVEKRCDCCGRQAVFDKFQMQPGD